MRDWIQIGAKPTMRQIAADVAKAHGIGAADIYITRPRKWIAHPRQEAMARMSWAGYSHTQIVRHFGLKNHTTSIHARNAVEARGLDYRVPVTPWLGWQIKATARDLARALAQREAAA